LNKDNFYFLGIITKPTGLKGDLSISLDVDDPWKYEKMESVFVEIDNELVPFFIEKIEIRPNNKAIIRFKDLKKEETNTMVKRNLYLPLDQLPKLSGKKFYFHEVIGFEIVDTKYGNIGKIETILEIQPQAIFQISLKGREILIPVVDEIIKDVDRKNKKIIVDTPEGLIDLYLNT